MEIEITEQEKASLALKTLIEAAEIGQATGIYTIADAAQIFSAIKFFKPNYGVQNEEIVDNKTVAES